jgi:hypothetical protein
MGEVGRPKQENTVRTQFVGAKTPQFTTPSAIAEGVFLQLKQPPENLSGCFIILRSISIQLR